MRIELFGDEVERIRRFDALTGDTGEDIDELVVFPATHYVAGDETMRRAIASIEAELGQRLAELQAAGKLLEAQRLRMRTEHDLEMLAEVGVCNGIENYSRHLDGRSAGEPPHTLLDFFPADFLTVIDESHVAVPQIHGQYEGDRSRKETLVEHGFRLPSALDNRPLTFDEFTDRVGQVMFLSATPGAYEIEVSSQVVEQVIRPTGLVDPEVVIQPTTGQIDDLHRAHPQGVGGGRALPRHHPHQEDGRGPHRLPARARRAGPLPALRHRHHHPHRAPARPAPGEYDVLVGINLLREGLDLPEVQLVAILDADKTGFLRSASSLIQTMGRAARNVDGLVVLYADTITDAMRDGHLRDPAPPGPAAGLQRRARHRPHHHPQGRDRHPGPHPARRRRHRARPGRRAVAAAGPGPGTAGAGAAACRGRRRGRPAPGRGTGVGGDDTTAVDEMAELAGAPRRRAAAPGGAPRAGDATGRRASCATRRRRCCATTSPSSAWPWPRRRSSAAPGTPGRPGWPLPVPTA